MKIILLRYIFVFFIFNNSMLSNAQKGPDLRTKSISKVLFKGNYFAFYLSPYISQKAKTVPQSGEYSMDATNSSGIEVGGNYFINFGKSYSLIVAAHADFSGRNVKLNISKSDFTPNLENDINFHGRLTKDCNLYLSLPIWFEKRWWKKNNGTWNVDAGVNIRFDPDVSFYFYNYLAQDVNGQYTSVLVMEGYSGHDLKPWINYNIGGGYSLFLSNYNFLRINLLTNFSVTKVTNFNYTINVTGKPQSTGTYSANLSYVGLSVQYILSDTNKRLVKLYENTKN